MAHENVESATIEAAGIAWFGRSRLRTMPWDLTLTGIGSFETASGDGGWEYWVNDNHALVSIEQHPLPDFLRYSLAFPVRAF
ncbi:MAG: hypothetical protein ACJZ59_07295 [Candidatus Thalassarchaeaceae archaeon]